MALSTPSASPAVVVKEIDLTGGVPNVQSTTGAIVGNFRWGPVEERKNIANETELAATFANPDSDNTIDFHSATYFLRYSSSGVVVRAITSSARNAHAERAATKKNYDLLESSDSSSILFSGAPGFYASDAAFLAEGVTISGNPVSQDSADAQLLTQTLVVKNETSWDAQASALGDITHPVDTTAFSALNTTDSDGFGDSSGSHSGNLYYDPATAFNGITKQTDTVGNFTFVAKYPGELGNSLKVSICGPSSEAFDGWDYRDEFDGVPGTSSFASNRGGQLDEIHVAVVDEEGLFTGTIGAVLETFPYLSVFKNAVTSDQANNYVKDVLNNRSDYVWFAQFDSDFKASGAGKNARPVGAGIMLNAAWADSAVDYSFSGGVNSDPLGVSEYLTGFDQFEDKDQVEVDFLIAPGMTARESQTTVVNDLIATAQQTRKDCVVVASPARDDVVNQSNVSNIIDDVVATADTFTKSSYLVMDNNYLKVYDKYNDQYIFIPAASSTAGIMAATDLNRAPWFSPAGSRRGQYLGITSIAYTPTKGQRDTLYKASVNPIANIPGQGVLLYGDKTGLARPSAFDRINVRRLFLILERAIGRAAQQVLFEFNDEFTRAEFVNIIEPVLREIKGRRGITDFRVVADETNNTPEVIDRNEFIANIFIKPARSINYVTLNFVAVRTGVDFEEVVGTV
jgi:hypothetical protein